MDDFQDLDHEQLSQPHNQDDQLRVDVEENNHLSHQLDSTSTDGQARAMHEQDGEETCSIAEKTQRVDTQHNSNQHDLGHDNSLVQEMLREPRHHEQEEHQLDNNLNHEQQVQHVDQLDQGQQLHGQQHGEIMPAVPDIHEQQQHHEYQQQEQMHVQQEQHHSHHNEEEEQQHQHHNQHSEDGHMREQTQHQHHQEQEPMMPPISPHMLPQISLTHIHQQDIQHGTYQQQPQHQVQYDHETIEMNHDQQHDQHQHQLQHQQQQQIQQIQEQHLEEDQQQYASPSSSSMISTPRYIHGSGPLRFVRPHPVAKDLVTRTASRFRGVSRSGGGWQARIRINGKQKYLGRYMLEEDAAKAFDSAALQYHEEKAITNYGPDGMIIIKEDEERPELINTGIKRPGAGSGASRFKGVTRNGRGWQARIRVNGKQRYLGRFGTETEAALCFDAASKKYHGPKAPVNFVPKASKYRGVTKSGKCWQARIREDGVQKYLGRFDTQHDAALAFDEASRKQYGDKAVVNFDLHGKSLVVGDCVYVINSHLKRKKKQKTNHQPSNDSNFNILQRANSQEYRQQHEGGMDDMRGGFGARMVGTSDSIGGERAVVVDDEEESQREQQQQHMEVGEHSGVGGGMSANLDLNDVNTNRSPMEQHHEHQHVDDSIDRGVHDDVEVGGNESQDGIELQQQEQLRLQQQRNLIFPTYGLDPANLDTTSYE